MNYGTLEKRTTKAFNKRIYLLGKDETGENYWLEHESWDCGWYWGFGYIETYTNNNNPDKAKDIESHSHATEFMSEYFTSWNGSKPILTETTFSEKEGWELSELFAQYYLLKDVAEYFMAGKCNTAHTSIPLYRNKDLVKDINVNRLPIIFKRIREILSPKG